MKPYTLKYLRHFGYDISSFIPCEICEARAVDIHHIDARGMGSSKDANNIQNLMALCRNCHLEYGDKKQFKEYLKEIHNKKLAA